VDLLALGGGVLTTIARVSPTTCYGSGGNYKFGGGREVLSLLSLLLATFRRKIQSGWPLGRIARHAENCKVGRKQN